ncbi:MAG TPA: MFS transporter [Anaerolineae bacterium]|nr:MFS transporter [Anaerolineae bacterium]
MQADAKKVANREHSAETFQTERVVTVAASHFSHDIFSTFISAALPLIREKFALTYSVVGTLPVFAQLPILLTPFIGYLADRFSVRYFIIFAPAVTATLMGMMGLAPSYTILALLLLVTGFSIAAFHAPASAMIGALAGNRVGRGMSIFMAAGELGRAAGPILFAWGVLRFGLEGLWRLSIIGWIASAVLFWRLHNVKAAKRASDSRTLREVVPTLLRFFPVLVWFMLTRNMMVAAVTTYLTTFMNDVVQVDFRVAAGALSILEGAGVVGALVSGTVSDWFGRKRILFFLFISAPLLLLAFLYAPPIFAIPLLIALGFTAITHTPVYFAIVQDYFPDNRALANGVFLALSFTIRSLNILLLGTIADNYGLERAYLVAALVASTAILGLPFLPTGKKQITPLPTN